MQNLFNNLSDTDLFTAFFILSAIIFSIVSYFAFKKKIELIKENFERKTACDKAKMTDSINRYTKYFWSQPLLSVLITLIFLLFYILSLFLYQESKIVLFVLILTLYAVFVKYAIIWYLNFPKEAQKALEAHKKAIIDAICNELKNYRKKIDKLYNINYSNKNTSDCHDNIIVHPTGIEKLNFPLLVTLTPPKKVIISKVTFQIIALEEYFMLICPKTTEFNLLYPARTDKIKKCTLIRGTGECEDILYSIIKDVKYEESAIKLYFFADIEEPKIIAYVAKKEDAKPTITKIKEKVRIIQNKGLNKITDPLYYKMYKK